MAQLVDKPTFTDKRNKRLKQICGRFLYYARAIDKTMMHALNDLATQITTGTKITDATITCFFEIAWQVPTLFIYWSSNMLFRADSDADYQPSWRLRLPRQHRQKPADCQRPYHGPRNHHQDGRELSGRSGSCSALPLCTGLCAPSGYLHQNGASSTPNTSTHRQRHRRTSSMAVCNQNLAKPLICVFTGRKTESAKMLGTQLCQSCRLLHKHHSLKHVNSVRPIYLKEDTSPWSLQVSIKLLIQ